MPLISIVIPTGGRTATVGCAIASALAFFPESCEVIVSDNDFSGATASLLRTMELSGVRVVRPQTRLPMTEHFNFAVEHASGDYVLVLGDDDAVVPGAGTAVAKVMLSSNPDIVTAAQHVYLWPTSERQGGIWHVAGLRRSVELSLARSAKRSLRLGGARWERTPSIYRSFVHRRALNRLKGRIGSITKTMIPDMYMSFALAGLGTTCINAGIPFAIGGMAYNARKMPKILDRKVDDRDDLTRHVMEHDVRSLPGDLPNILPPIINALTDSIRSAVHDFPDMYDGAQLNMNAHYAWVASWGSVGTIWDFHAIRRQLHATGFCWSKFALWYAAFRIQHTISASRARKMASINLADDILKAAQKITALQHDTY